jgi:hypothetical protein
MAVLGKTITQKSGTRIKADNKIQIQDGTRRAKIVEIWIYNVDADGKWTAEKTAEQKACVKVQFIKRPDLVLEKRMRAYLSKNSHFAKFIQSLTGIEAGSDEMLQYDTDKLLGMDVFVTTKYEEPYTNVTAIAPPEVVD